MANHKVMYNSKTGCNKEVIKINQGKFDIGYLTYKEFKLKENEYKQIAKLKTMELVGICESEKLTINNFLLIYEEEIKSIKRKIEYEIVKETLY